MSDEFINKYISVLPSVWDRLKAFSAKPENRRAPGHQAGMIIKEFLDNQESCESCKKILSENDGHFTDSEGVHLCKSCYKKEVE